MALELKYFILKPKSKFKNDPYAIASRKAMEIYADFIYDIDKNLSNALKKWAYREKLIDTKMEEIDND